MDPQENFKKVNFQHDRRRFIRLSLEPPLEVNFRLEHINRHFELTSSNTALIKNISIAGGLVIELMLKSDEIKDKLLYGSEKIRLEIELPGKISSQIKIIGKIVWMQKMTKAGSFYEAGISFENIDEKAQETILHTMIDLAFKQKNLKI